jgi:acyl-[acyl-carrier-protein]-phospholipid O-acyltransferase/long-chain-fatty-acid--[acyl-carrier-protein] ligase
VMKKCAPSKTAVILFTSGSESKPKAVLHSHSSILSNIQQINAVLDFNPSDRFIMVLPIFHAFGFTGTLLSVLNGISVYIFPSPLLYKQIPEEIDKKACTVLFATNTFLNHYAKYADRHQFKSLRYVIAGAEKLSDTVRHLYKEKYNIHILEGYGATECAPVLSVNTPSANKTGSVGRFVPDITYRLKPVSGIEQGGVLQVKGPNMMQGYYYHHQPSVLCPPTDGWYDTGDIVHVDEEGFIFILGREKRFAKVAGEMVSLMVVEQIAQAASPDFHHAASTQADTQRGETIVLFTTDAKLTREDLQTASKKLGCPEIAIARKIMWIAEIPILSTGKTDYAQIKTLAELV